jgi:hypothetical protein
VIPCDNEITDTAGCFNCNEDSLNEHPVFVGNGGRVNTGAWSKYAAFGLGVDLPNAVLPQDVAASVTAGVGYYWFGNQSAALGGFALPAYYNWNAGLTFKRKIFSLDLRYYDTNLSKENCFVFTGDPNASPGGQVNPVTNPEGLTSGWCSATFRATYRAVPIMSDGTEGPPLALRGLFEQYDKETR